MVAIVLTATAAGTDVAQAQMVNPYAGIDWENVRTLHSFSHQHGSDPRVFWNMGFGHLPISNYYPSRPFYPLPEKFLKEHPEALGAPNAEQHSTTDSGMHFCAVGSLYTAGYGRTPRFKAGQAPIEHVFSGLHVFDGDKSPWLGVYRLDLRIAQAARTDQEAEVLLTIEGAEAVSHKTFAPVGDGLVRRQRVTSKSPESMYLKTTAADVRVRLEFDPASTRIDRFRLMQGTNRPWKDAFRAALDGTGKDSAGRPIEGLLFPDGGGITINHPGGSLKSLLEALDFDRRVLGIEVWNQHEGFGGTEMRFYRLWDEALRSGRQCLGFFVKDHVFFGRGRNVLLVSSLATASPREREHEALRGYRDGRFFGLLGALKTDESGQPVSPYDKSEFRFTRIAVKHNGDRRPTGIEVSVDGADRTKRPNTQIRFITDAGVAKVVDDASALFEFPQDAAGVATCRFVRVEAFAYPSTHLGGRPLTPEALSAMNVHEISRLHDRQGPFRMSDLDPSGTAPIPIVDMIFSQPILLQKDRDSHPLARIIHDPGVLAADCAILHPGSR
ncbi:MAG: hypothetical protein HUU20_02375 [Pirellulales bacterium]|nr:hypothetical protein [Pirellulales bacterium]